jgi:hypothetical protein
MVVGHYGCELAEDPSQPTPVTRPDSIPGKQLSSIGVSVMIRIKCIAFLVFATIPGVSVAQTPTNHVSVQTVQRYRQANDLTNELQTILDKLNAEKLRPVVSGSWEEQVMGAAKQSALHAFRIDLRDPGAGAYTLFPQTTATSCGSVERS